MNKIAQFSKLLFASFLLLQSCQSNLATQVNDSSSNQINQFTGRYLLAISDADMMASAYVDGKLMRSPDAKDTLSVISLPTNGQNSTVAQLNVSNSVASWPNVIAVSPNGNIAYIVETRGSASQGVQQVKNVFTDLPAGAKVVAVDLSNPQKPVVANSLRLGRNPHNISINLEGNLLAIATDEPGKGVKLVEVNGTQFGRRFTLSVKNSEGKQPSRVSDIEWHPSGRYLAVTLDDREITFQQVIRDARGNITLKPWGEAIKTINFPGAGKFTADGRFYVVPNLQWRTKTNELDYNNPPSGQLAVIRMATNNTESNEVVSAATVGISPEGFDLSPDDSLIVAANARRSHLPWEDPRLTRESSISLVKMDKKTGRLTTIGEYKFKGIMPQGVAFDAEGKSVAVTLFDTFDPEVRQGKVEFWRVIRGETPSLEKMGTPIDVVRGPHDLTLVR
ncbi:MAG: lactonase family protein [Hydrococcus sp. Prado102]|nr:lactonase family protein [Hydrococcus sp. Prado102]